jgi:hypothetical protein
MTTAIKIFKLKTICFVLFALSNLNAFSQNITLSQKTKVSVLTCDKGNELHSLFGHTAIRILDPVNDFDAVYNFGYFDFKTPNFYLKFVKGDMKYFVAVDNFQNFMAEYVYYQRGVYEQELNVSQVEKQKIFNNLNQILQSDERFYTYKFIDRNCTTMVADLLEKNTSIKISNDIADKNKTNREILYQYLGNHFYENLGINIIFGHKTDATFKKVFLPLQLLEGLNKSKNSVSKNTTLNIQSATTPFSVWNNIYSLILALSLIIILNKKWLTMSYFILLSIIGIFLFCVGFYSFHEEVSTNYNIVLFNPLYLVLIFLIYKNKKEFAKKVIYFLLISLLLYLIFVANKPFTLIFLPFIIANFVLLYKQKKQVSN